MTEKNDVVVATMSGTFVIELLLNTLTFNRAALVLGGPHLLSVVLDELWIRLHQDAPKQAWIQLTKLSPTWWDLRRTRAVRFAVRMGRRRGKCPGPVKRSAIRPTLAP